jgi:hypothetical protein
MRTNYIQNKFFFRCSFHMQCIMRDNQKLTYSDFLGYSSVNVTNTWRTVHSNQRWAQDRTVPVSCPAAHQDRGSQDGRTGQKSLSCAQLSLVIKIITQDVSIFFPFNILIMLEEFSCHISTCTSVLRWRFVQCLQVFSVTRSLINFILCRKVCLRIFPATVENLSLFAWAVWKL